MLYRITPACAGKRNANRKKQTETKDHPRMCGEKFYTSFDVIFYEGSPPHVRGKVMRKFVETLPCRITPACAGKRYNKRINALNSEDHPRMCGEK